MEIKGIDEFIKQCEKDVEKHFNTMLTNTGKKLLRDVRNNTPAPTGKLRRSWRARKKGTKSLLVYNTQDYAPHVEYGHRTRHSKDKMGDIKVVTGRFILKKGMLRTRKYLKEEFNVAVKQIFGG